MKENKKLNIVKRIKKKIVKHEIVVPMILRALGMFLMSLIKKVRRIENLKQKEDYQNDSLAKVSRNIEESTG